MGGVFILENDHAITLFKFGEHRWMQKFLLGELSFSCIGKFIWQAKYTENEIQGDRLEGVFAKLKVDDYKNIRELEFKYGKDLEKIEKDNYLLFRRKSSLKRPIFCLYGYKAEDLLTDNNKSIKRVGIQSLGHIFDDRMFDGFSNGKSTKNVLVEDRQMEIITLSPQAFVNNFKEAVKFLPFDMQIRNELYNDSFKHGEMQFEMKTVNYDYFKQETFILPVTNKYEELFYKFPEYEYQHEARICCYNKSFDSINDRFTLYVRSFHLDDEAYVINQRFKVRYDVKIDKQ